RSLRRNPQPARQLRIGLLASFATLWLAPRLSGFLLANPDIQVELVPAWQLADVAGGEVDLAIRYGKGGWANVSAELLMTERISPVCSPAFKAQWLTAQKNRKRADLSPGPLLTSQSSIPATSQFEWLDWARK